MLYPTPLLAVLASLALQIESEIGQAVDARWNDCREAIKALILEFRAGEVSAATLYDFEKKLRDAVREFARQIVELAVNQIEPENPQEMPHYLKTEAGEFRRLNNKTRNSHVTTLFGTITLRRYSYRFCQKDVKESNIFPLETRLGLVRHATPALAEVVARSMAQTGATQQSVLDRLRSEHNVIMGVGRLRDITAEVSQAFEPLTEEAQAEQVLKWLQEAENGPGEDRPVLSAGRDGVTMRDYQHGFFEYATAGTLTVYGRDGKRLGSVYLAFVPEEGQRQMTARLTSLLEKVLAGWKGPLPRLCYVTDAGDYETKYYREVLRKMRHPQTGEKLEWTRIVDYYHVSKRIWTMAEVLFGAESVRGAAWARRMCRLLKKRNGPSRVLHSAGAMRARVKKISQAKDKEFRTACNYIRQRTKIMQYYEYQQMNLPIGSGVTEAACKTLIVQRLKLSGMRWQKQNAQLILNLRVVLLSGIWSRVYRSFLEARTPHTRPYASPAQIAGRKAA